LSDVVSAVAFPVLNGPTASPAAEAAGRAAGYAAGRRAAEAELAELREHARAELAHGRAEAQGEIETALTLLGTAADDYARRSAPLIDTLDAALLGAAVQIAEAILQRELADETTAALGAVRRAMSVAGDDHVRRIRLHPADLAVLEALGELPVEAVADATLERGDAIADLEHGSVDARLATAVARVRAALAEGDVA
jgi:flagellar assembly protein FliH